MSRGQWAAVRQAAWLGERAKALRKSSGLLREWAHTWEAELQRAGLGHALGPVKVEASRLLDEAERLDRASRRLADRVLTDR